MPPAFPDLKIDFFFFDEIYKIDEDYCNDGEEENDEDESERENEAFFADDPALDGITFDTTGCALDTEGRFTETGTFTVQVVYDGMTATYKIRVAEAE